ncbi:hypothetical protein NHQ30_002297 [Ciborinia camelliae]|nr:hypothetical protein NHQ30_002297 [Ciborinia camelliae]
MANNDQSSGNDMQVGGRDEFTALQTTHTWLSNPYNQSGNPKNNGDNSLESLDLQIPPSLFNFPETFSLPLANDSFEHESSIFEESHSEHILLQSLGDEEASNCDFSSQPILQHTSPQNKKTCAAGLESCSTAALNTLRKLHVPRLAGLCIFQKSCVIADVLPPPMLDEILRMNAQAMQSISRMLECSCIEKMSLYLMTCIICNKIVSVNSKMLAPGEQAGSSEEPDENYMTATPRLDINAEAWQNDQMSLTPVRVGNFTLEGDIGGRIRSYVLLEDVKRLRTMIERLSARAVEGTSSAILQDLLERLDRLHS